jgi:hypothetical protein
MCAYSVINGNFACQNPYLVSRERGSFTGLAARE